jgi:hypothetical protein
MVVSKSLRGGASKATSEPATLAQIRGLVIAAAIDLATR